MNPNATENPQQYGLRKYNEAIEHLKVQRLNGTKPLSPDSLLKRSIRPALARAGIVDKQIGWHNFRHSLATNLRAMGVDIKVAQELLRHANSRTTLDIYTRAVSQQKRDANTQMVEMLQPASMKKPQHLLAPINPDTAGRAES
jgi:site-specific recombinase XerD